MKLKLIKDNTSFLKRKGLSELPRRTRLNPVLGLSEKPKSLASLQRHKKSGLQYLNQQPSSVQKPVTHQNLFSLQNALKSGSPLKHNRYPFTPYKVTFVDGKEVTVLCFYSSHATILAAASRLMSGELPTVRQMTVLKIEQITKK